MDCWAEDCAQYDVYFGLNNGQDTVIETDIKLSLFAESRSENENN
ncbi:hypothetical protein VIRA109638_06225 [Vibrio rarus]